MALPRGCSSGVERLPSKQNVRLSLAVQLFLTAKRAQRVSPRTLETYQRAVTRFVASLPDNVTEPADITANHVRAYIAAMIDHHRYTAWTIHDAVRPVKTWLRFLHREGLLDHDIMLNVDMPRLAKPILPAFEPEDVKRLLAACTSRRDTALLLTLLDTGLRAGELCALTVDDLNPTTGAITVRSGKGSKGRMVFLGAKARRAVLRYLLSREASGPLFLGRGGRAMTPTGVLLLCRRVGQRAGVPDCHPHRFRRTFALWSLRAGMNVYALQQIMGHSSLTMLRQYLALVDGDAANAHREHGAVDVLLG